MYLELNILFFTQTLKRRTEVSCIRTSEPQSAMLRDAGIFKESNIVGGHWEDWLFI